MVSVDCDYSDNGNSNNEMARATFLASTIMTKVMIIPIIFNDNDFRNDKIIIKHDSDTTDANRTTLVRTPTTVTRQPASTAKETQTFPLQERNKPPLPFSLQPESEFQR